MIITACGAGCLRVQTGGLTLITEPFSGELSNRFKPDIVLKRNCNPQTPFPAGSDPFIVIGPGEYEIKGIEIRGYERNNYLVKAEDIKLGFLSEKETIASEPLEEVDLLFVSMRPETEKIIKQLEPKIVIPLSGDIEELARVFNQKPIPQEKLTIKKKDLPAQGPQIVLLS